MIKPRQVAPMFLVVAILAALGALIAVMSSGRSSLTGLLAGVAVGSLIVSGIAAWSYRRASSTLPPPNG